MDRPANAVPVVGEKNPSGQVERMQCPRSAEGLCQEGEIGLGEMEMGYQRGKGELGTGGLRTVGGSTTRCGSPRGDPDESRVCTWEIIAGSRRGADTAIVVKPAHTPNIFDIRIREIIAMPRS